MATRDRRRSHFHVAFFRGADRSTNPATLLTTGETCSLPGRQPNQPDGQVRPQGATCRRKVQPETPATRIVRQNSPANRQRVKYFRLLHEIEYFREDGAMAVSAESGAVAGREPALETTVRSAGPRPDASKHHGGETSAPNLRPLHVGVRHASSNTRRIASCSVIFRACR